MFPSLFWRKLSDFFCQTSRGVGDLNDFLDLSELRSGSNSRTSATSATSATPAQRPQVLQLPRRLLGVLAARSFSKVTQGRSPSCRLAFAGSRCLIPSSIVKKILRQARFFFLTCAALRRQFLRYSNGTPNGTPNGPPTVL